MKKKKRLFLAACGFAARPLYVCTVLRLLLQRIGKQKQDFAHSLILLRQEKHYNRDLTIRKQRRP